MSDASTSLGEKEVDNNNDQGDSMSMDTSSNEVGSLKEDDSVATSTSTNGHGSDKNIDDVDGDETLGCDDTNGDEGHDDSDDSSTSSTSSSDDEDSDDDEEERMEMLISDTIKFEEMRKQCDDLQALISRDPDPKSQMASFSRLYAGQRHIRECQRGLLEYVFSNFNKERYNELERIGTERGLAEFTTLASQMGFEDQIKTLSATSRDKRSEAAAGNNIGDDSSLGNSGGSSIQHQQQHNMRRTSLDQEQDDDGEAPLIRKRDRSPRSSDSSSSDINRLTKHCSSSSSSAGESDQGRRRLRRRRRLNGTDSPRQESEGNGALALENARLRKELEKHQKKMATKEAGLKRKQQELAKGKELLNKKIAEGEARILQAESDAKAESDRLARERKALEQEKEKRKEMLEVEMLRRAKEKKARLEAEMLSIEQDKIRSLFDSLDERPIAVASLREVEAVARRLEVAFDPQAPNLSLIPEITRDLLAIHQNIAKYKKLITNHITTNKAKSIDPLLDIDLNKGIGSILLDIAKNVAAKDRALNHVVSPELLELMAAVQRFQTGKECDVRVPDQLSSTDINKLRDLFKSDQGVECSVLHCIHLTLMVWVESELSVEQLYLHLDKDGFLLVTELWNQARQDEFDPNMSSLEYREKAIVPAQNGNDERLQQLATQVAMAFANNLTLSGSDERVAIIQSVLQLVEKKKFDGSSSDVQDDVRYFSEPGDQHKARRKSCTCILFNASASELIENRLPEQVPDGNSMVDLFPNGYLRALLINSSTFCKKSCNFVSPNRGLFKEGHDLEQTAKDMYKRMKSRDITAEKMVIIGRNEKDSLERLFGM